MRVALDATPLTLSSGGLRRYVEELTLALARNFPEDAFKLISDQPFELHSAGIAPPNLECDSGSKGIVNSKWWLAGAALATKKHNADVFHGTNFEVPLLPLCPSVMTIHDLSPWKNPEWHPSGTRVRRRTPLLLRAQRANALITPSQAVRREVIEHFGIAAERVFAVPEAASALFRRTMAFQHSEPYLLFVGTLEPRKNVGLLLEAWREVRKRQQVHLVVAGRTRADFPPISNEPGLALLGEVSDETLARLYSGCAAFIYPSFYEGFGLPVLEAMQCGAPVVTSRDAALLEVTGDAAIRIETAAELVEAIVSLLTNQEFARQQQEKSLNQALDFSWRRTALLTRAVYEEAIGRFA